MDWVHCNLCFKPPSQSDSNFILTSCGHIFCALCKNEECRICLKACTIKKLDSDMPPDVAECFEEREALIEKAIKVYKFQLGHRMNLIKGSEEFFNKKYNEIKQEIRKQEARRAELKSKAKKLEQKIEQYSRNEASSRGRNNMPNFTPCSNGNVTPFCRSRSSNNQLTPSTLFTGRNPGSSGNQFRRPMMASVSFSKSTKGTPNSASDFESNLTTRSTMLSKSNRGPNKHQFRRPPFQNFSSSKSSRTNKSILNSVDGFQLPQNSSWSAPSSSFSLRTPQYAKDLNNLQI